MRFYLYLTCKRELFFYSDLRPGADNCRMISSLTLTLILGLVWQINADYYEGRYNTSERIYRLFDTGTHWKRLVKSYLFDLQKFVAKR